MKGVDEQALIFHNGDGIVLLSLEEIQLHPKVPAGLNKRFKEFATQLS